MSPKAAPNALIPPSAPEAEFEKLASDKIQLLFVALLSTRKRAVSVLVVKPANAEPEGMLIVSPFGVNVSSA